MASAELLLVGRGRYEPREEGAVLNQRLPARSVPVHVFLRGHGGTWLAAEEDNDGIGFGGDESEEEDVLGAAVVAFERRVAERGGGVQLDFLVAGAYEMIDDMRRRRITAGAAEPFTAGKALDDAAGVVNTAIRAYKKKLVYVALHDAYHSLLTSMCW